MGAAAPRSSRRALLLGILAVGGSVAACTAGRQRKQIGPTHTAQSVAGSTPSAQPSELLAVIDDERRLVAGYVSAIAAIPSLRARLQPIHGDHAAHLAALQRAAGSTPSSPAPRPSLPTSASATLAALVHAESAAAAARIRSCLHANQQDAALLGSIAASEASHVVALGGR